MEQTGLIGLHIVASSPGYSRDISRRNARQVGSRYSVVVNDYALCAELLADGVIPIYRVKSTDFDDDNLHQHVDARAYVRKLDFETKAVGAGAAMLYWNNEPGNQDLPVLKREMLAAIDEANKLKRTLVMLNIAYRNWTMADWDYLADALREAVKGGHFIGVHEGYKSPEFPDLASAVPECIGRFIAPMQKYGFKVICTEFAASLKPDYGWSAWLSVPQWLVLLRDAVREVYSKYGVPICVFTLYEWLHDFSYVNEETLKNGMAMINRDYPAKEPQVTTTQRLKITGFPPNIAYRNIRNAAQATSNESDIGDLRVGDVVDVTLPPINNWAWLTRPADKLTGWVLWSGVQTEAVEAPPAAKSYTFTEAQLTELRRLTKQQDDTNAALMALLDEGTLADSSGGFR